MNKAVVLALVGVLAVIATGLASAGLDPRAAYELAAAVSPLQDPAPPEGRERETRTRRRAARQPAPMTGVATSTTTTTPTARARPQAARRRRRQRGQGQQTMSAPTPTTPRSRRSRSATTRATAAGTRSPRPSARVKDGHAATRTTSSRRSITRTRRSRSIIRARTGTLKGRRSTTTAASRRTPPPSCPSQAEVTATDASGQGSRDQYTCPEPVYARGENLPPNATFAVTVTHNRAGTDHVERSPRPPWLGGLRRPRLGRRQRHRGRRGVPGRGDARGVLEGDNFQYRTARPPEKPKLIVRKNVVGAPGQAQERLRLQRQRWPDNGVRGRRRERAHARPRTYNVTRSRRPGSRRRPTTAAASCSRCRNSRARVHDHEHGGVRGALEAHRAEGGGRLYQAGERLQLHGQRRDDAVRRRRGENIVTLPAGTYTVTEPQVSGFTTTYAGLQRHRRPVTSAAGAGVRDHEHRGQKPPTPCGRSGTS